MQPIIRSCLNPFSKRAGERLFSAPVNAKETCKRLNPAACNFFCWRSTHHMSSALTGSFQCLRSIRIDGIANLFFGRLSTRLRSEMSSDPLHARSTTDNGSFMFYSAFLPCGVASLLLPTLALLRALNSRANGFGDNGSACLHQG